MTAAFHAAVISSSFWLQPSTRSIIMIKHMQVALICLTAGNPLTRMCCTLQSEQLRFAQRKVIPFGRHAEARAAIFGKSKPPPMAPAQPSQRNLKPGQPTLQDLWRLPSSAIHTANSADDMEF